MKVLNKICWILAIALGVGSLVLFFLGYAKIVTSDTTVTPIAAQLAFGSKVKAGETVYNMAKSAALFLNFFLVAIGAVISIFSFKSKGLRYTAPAFGIVSAIYMLVIALAKSPTKFIDVRPIENISEVTFTPIALIIAIALFGFTAFSLAYLFIDDYLEVLASKGAKLTIAKRIVRFFRDYKSEIKKIVWPGFKEVVKNTLIVLIICLIIGAFIWLVDFGLGKLLNLILGLK